MIRLTVPSLDEADFAAVRAVLESGFLVQGAQVEAFEASVAEAAGTAHAVAVTNCTAALQMALMALDIRPGDTVVCLGAGDITRWAAGLAMAIEKARGG